MSGAELSRRVKISQPSVFKIENGGGVDSLSLYRLADVFGVTCDYFRPFIDPAVVPPEPVAPVPAPRPRPMGKYK